MISKRKKRAFNDISTAPEHNQQTGLYTMELDMFQQTRAVIGKSDILKVVHIS